MSEYSALRRGAVLRIIDEMERDASQALNITRAGAYDKNGKSLIRKFEDLFDRRKVERIMLDGVNKEIDPELAERFAASKERAERTINEGISVS